MSKKNVYICNVRIAIPAEVDLNTIEENEIFTRKTLA